MNFRKLYAAIEVFITVSIFSSLISGFWSLIITIGIKIYFVVDEDTWLKTIFLPTCLFLYVLSFRPLERYLRRRSLISEELYKFGPWIKIDKHH